MEEVWEDAIKHGNLQVVIDLLEQGIDVDSQDRYGQTALMLAAHVGLSKIVEILIMHGANLNITAKFGLSAIMLWASSGDSLSKIR